MEKMLIVGIGDVKVGEAPAKIKTTLGSCIGLCLYDQKERKGGMLHFMLPTAANPEQEQKKAKYADSGTELLLKELRTHYGIETSSLTAKIFGGAKTLSMVTQDIGKNNADKIKEILKEKNIRIIAECIGGEKGYQIELDLETGKVISRVFGQEPKEF